MIVVSDATPLNILIRAELVWLLPELYGGVIVPGAVYKELTHPSTPQSIRDLLATGHTWLSVRSPTLVVDVGPQGPGEREAIALAKELGADLLPADDKAARKAAAKLGIATTGTLGILELASARGLEPLEASVTKVSAQGLFLAPKLIQDALQRDRERKSRPADPGS